MNYKIVFDISQAGYKSWSFPAFGLIFVMIGIILVANRGRLPGNWRKRPRASAAFAIFFLAFSVLWTLVVLATTYHQYSSLTAADETRNYGVVEGRVSNFKPMPASGHAMERFCVQDRCFEYSDSVVTAGFNNTSSHGGPIREGLPVRVTYVGSDIIKLEVATD